MFSKLQDIIAFLKGLGFSASSFKDSLPSFAKKLAPFLIFWGSLIFFLGMVYYEAAISLLPAPLRMGLHESGRSTAAYFSYGLAVVSDTATSYPTRSYLVVVLIVLVMHWIIIRFSSFVLLLANPLAILRNFGELPKEKQTSLVGGVISAVVESSKETRDEVIKITKGIAKYYALFRAFDLFYLFLLIIYVFNMTALVLVDALGLASMLSTKCLTFWGSQLENAKAFDACRSTGFIEPDLYWPPALVLLLVLASWFSLRHARTFRGLRVATALVASISILFLALSLGERKGKSELTLWRVQVANELTEVKGPTSKLKEWLLVSAEEGNLVLFDEDSATLHNYSASSGYKGLIFLEQVPFEAVGRGETANSALHRTANALACADCR